MIWLATWYARRRDAAPVAVPWRVVLALAAAALPAAFVRDYWQLGGFAALGYALAVVCSAAAAGALAARMASCEP